RRRPIPRETMMDKPVIDDLIGQLETMRRERKQLLGAGSVLVVAGLVLVAAGAGFVRKSRVIEAEQILLRDHDGRVRARLATACGTAARRSRSPPGRTARPGCRSWAGMAGSRPSSARSGPSRGGRPRPRPPRGRTGTGAPRPPRPWPRPPAG